MTLLRPCSERVSLLYGIWGYMVEQIVAVELDYTVAMNEKLLGITDIFGDVYTWGRRLRCNDRNELLRPIFRSFHVLPISAVVGLDSDSTWVRISRTSLNPMLVLASLLCSNTTTLSLCSFTSEPFFPLVTRAFPRRCLTNACKPPMSLFNSAISCLITYINSEISVDLSSKSVFRLATARQAPTHHGKQTRRESRVGQKGR